jgi:hypothetical protein
MRRRAAIATPPACGSMSMGTEPRPPAFYAMVADARLRDGIPDAAIDILKPAYAAQPDNDDIARRLGMAYVMTTRYARRMPVLDGFLSRHPPIRGCCSRPSSASTSWCRAGRWPSVADVTKMRATSPRTRAGVDAGAEVPGGDSGEVTLGQFCPSGATTRGPRTAARSSTGSTSAPTCGVRTWACPTRRAAVERDFDDMAGLG